MKLLILFTLTFGSVYSQKFHFTVEPSIYTTFGTNYQKWSLSEGSTIEIMKMSQFGNISGGTINYGLAFSFLDITPKFKLGVIIHNSFSVNGFAFSYNTPIGSAIIYPGYGQSATFKDISSPARVNFGLFLRHQLSCNKNRYNHFLNFSIVNGYNISNSFPFTTGLSLQDGAISYVETPDSNSLHKPIFALTLKYEATILSKKKQRFIYIVYWLQTRFVGCL